MCKDCGCSFPSGTHHHSHGHHHHHDESLVTNPQLNDSKTLSVIQKILDTNDHEAEHNREHFARHHVSAFNLMSSPGSGKTTLLEHLQDYTQLKYSVIEGDLETARDAERLQAKGIDAYQIQTGSACHLDAFMVHGALHHVNLEKIDICFVENVGNLVCPASYDVGTHKNIVLVSVPEGDDKIEKYPVMFRRADLVLLTKCDLLPYFDFKVDAAVAAVKKLNPEATILPISIKDPESMQLVVAWLQANLQSAETMTATQQAQ